MKRQADYSIHEVLARAIEGFRRWLFLKRLNAGYARLRKDANAWAEVEAEREAWAATIADGLDQD